MVAIGAAGGDTARIPHIPSWFATFPMVPVFALRLIFGMSLTWCVMREQVTSGFFRIQMLVTLGLGVLATLTLSHLNDPRAPGHHWIYGSRDDCGRFVSRLGACGPWNGGQRGALRYGGAAGSGLGR